MEVLVEWDNGIQNIVPSSDLKKTGLNWRTQLPKLQVGERVKMRCPKKWRYGNILFVDKEVSSKIVDYFALLKIKNEDNPNNIGLSSEEEFRISKDLDPINLVANINQQISLESITNPLERRLENDTAIFENNKSAEVLEETSNCVEVIAMKSTETNAAVEENTSSTENMNFVTSELFTLEEDFSFTVNHSKGEKRESCDKGFSSNSSKRPALEHNKVGDSPSEVADNVQSTLHELPQYKPLTRKEHHQSRNSASEQEITLSAVRYPANIIKPCTVRVESNIASCMKPSEVYILTEGLIKKTSPKDDTKELESVQWILNETKFTSSNKEMDKHSADRLSMKETYLPKREIVSPIENAKSLPIPYLPVNKFPKVEVLMTNSLNIKECINENFSKLINSKQIRGTFLEESADPSPEIKMKASYSKTEKNAKNQSFLKQSTIMSAASAEVEAKKPSTKQKLKSTQQLTKTEVNCMTSMKEVVEQYADVVSRKETHFPKENIISPIVKDKSPPIPYMPSNEIPEVDILATNTSNIKECIDGNFPNLANGKQFRNNAAKAKLVHPERDVNPNLTECLDGAPPFIQEVFKCDNIRDGFINTDLVFVLSLLPDIEEMTVTQKLHFQLKVIEILKDVLIDPQLQIHPR